jgi:hypothetical protein
MENIIICWRGSDGDTKPVKCTCEKFGYPNFCIPEGEQEQRMYVNTHFRDINEAWESIIKSVHAGIKISGRHLIDVKKQLEKAEKDAADDLVKYTEVMENPDNPFKIGIVKL